METPEELRQQVHLLRQLIDSVSIPVFYRKTDGVYIGCNRAFEKFTGKSREEIAGKSIYDLFPREVADIYREGDKVLLTAPGKLEYEISLQHADGSKHEVILNNASYAGIDGNVSGIVGVMVDITDRKQMELEVQKSEEHYRLLADNANDIIWLLELSGNLRYISPSVERLLGYTIGEVLEIPFEDLFVPASYEVIAKKLEEVRSGIGAGERYMGSGIFELEYMRKNNSTMWGEITFRVINDNSGQPTGIMGVTRDITERIKVQRQLKEVLETRSQFISVASHELRTPLTAIKESIEIIGEAVGDKVDEETREFLGMAKRNIDRLARLINDILDFQKLEAGKAEFHMQKQDINDVVKEVKSSMATLVSQKGLEFILSLADNLPLVSFDKDKITQVLINLTNNAIKFTDKGSISIATLQENDGIIVSVADTGPGIKKEDLPKLFQKFQQLAAPNERKTGGTGLGLAISKQIIEQHGGKVWVESEVGVGTKFSFMLTN